MNTNRHRDMEQEGEDLLDRKFEISLRNAYRSIAGALVCAAAVLGVYYSFRIDMHDQQNNIILLKAQVQALEKRIELLEDKK